MVIMLNFALIDVIELISVQVVKVMFTFYASKPCCTFMHVYELIV